MLSGFILTMWYVNKVFAILFFPICKCFILTMWYVNWDLSRVFGIFDVSFILTMWYVNKFVVAGAEKNIKVLY